jgi:hypothetical protein
MNLIKKLGLIISAVAFCLSLAVVSADAQPGRAGWKNNNGKAKGWYKGQRNGWDKGRKTGWRNRTTTTIYQQRYQTGLYTQRDRYGRLTWQERQRLQRQRERLYRTQNRYYRDGYLSGKEQRKLNKRYNQYQRKVRRDRRDW